MGTFSHAASTPDTPLPVQGSSAISATRAPATTMEAVEPSASQGDPSARLEWCAVVDERSRIGCRWT